MLRLCLITGDKEGIKKLKLHCIHAEPNYGVLWFYFKHSALDSALDIWRRAKEQLKIEFEQTRELYTAAMDG